MEADLEKLIHTNGIDPACCVLRHVTRTSRLIVASFDAVLRPVGVTGHQYNVLITLARSGPLNVNGLAAAVGMHPSTTPRLNAPLIRKGLLRLQVGADRRERLIAITPKGHSLVVRGFPNWVELQKVVMNHLADGEWPSTMASLKTIRKALNASSRNLRDGR